MHHRTAPQFTFSINLFNKPVSHGVFFLLPGSCVPLKCPGMEARRSGGVEGGGKEEEKEEIFIVIGIHVEILGTS